MNFIRDTNGKVINRCQNLRAIRSYVNKHAVKAIYIDQVGQYEGQLSILFVNGSSFQTNFADYNILLRYVSMWKNLRGCVVKLGEKEVKLTHNNSLVDYQIDYTSLKKRLVNR